MHVKHLNRPFTKEDIKMVNKYMKRCSISLVIKEIEIEVMMGYHYALLQ